MNTRIKLAADRLLATKQITPEQYKELEKIALVGAHSIPTLLGAAAGEMTFRKAGVKAANRLIGKASPWLALAGLGYGAKEMIVEPILEQVQINKSYKQLADKVPSLQGKDPTKVQDYFNVVRSYSPRAAANPLVAGALVNKMMEFGGVDHKLVQDISNIQGGQPISTINSILESSTKSSLGAKSK